MALNGKKWMNFITGLFFDVAKGKGQQLFVGGLRGNFFAASDGGQDANTWQGIDIGVKSSVNRILVTDNKLILLGNAGLLLVSDDGGKSFNKFIQADGKAITSGVEVNGKLILTSQAGIKVIDGGRF